ncbi:MAG: hypothetical protein IPJ10_14345 [Flavobacteriales bacterium]|nr:hypothetical protein [Flavobacteriales bacterium]
MQHRLCCKKHHRRGRPLLFQQQGTGALSAERAVAPVERIAFYPESPLAFDAERIAAMVHLIFSIHIEAGTFRAEGSAGLVDASLFHDVSRIAGSSERAVGVANDRTLGTGERAGQEQCEKEERTHQFRSVVKRTTWITPEIRSLVKRAFSSMVCAS